MAKQRRQRKEELPARETELLGTVENPAILNPLSDVTRRERRLLLGTSLIAFAISQGGLIPSEISAFGIVVSEAEQLSLLALVALVLLYFEFAYVIYSSADLKARELAQFRGRHGISPALQEELKTLGERLRNQKGKGLENEELLLKYAQLSDQARLAGSIQKIGRLRVVFDVHLPVVVGFVALAFVVLNLRGYTGAAWAIGLVSVVAVIVGGFYLYTARRRVVRWLARRRRDWHKGRYKKIGDKLKEERLDKDERDKLVERMTKHMTASMKGPW